MADAGIDAVAYDDGPRPYYGVDRLITYVFYRFDRIGDYRTWNPPTFPDATERTDAILARS